MATLLRIKATGDPTAPILRRLENLRPAFEEGVAAWRDVGHEEFQTETWRRPGGSRRSWQPTKYPFGTDKGSGRMLQRSGALLRAYLGTGAGSIERVSGEGAEFGVAGSLLPYAAVHRGGSGDVLTADANRPARIRVTPKMRRFLAAAKGVYLRRSTAFIVIPRRPHFTVNAEVRTRITAIFAAHLGGRPIPRRGRAS